MKTIKKYKIFLILVLVIIVGVFSFFHRMYRHDMNALENFVAAYQKFDATPNAEALKELQTAAPINLSSLIKNEKQVMAATRAIAGLAEQELTNPSLQNQRRAAFTSFMDFGK